jgi:hypothetical protein
MRILQAKSRSCVPCRRVDRAMSAPSVFSSSSPVFSAARSPNDRSTSSDHTRSLAVEQLNDGIVDTLVFSRVVRKPSMAKGETLDNLFSNARLTLRKYKSAEGRSCGPLRLTVSPLILSNIRLPWRRLYESLCERLHSVLEEHRAGARNQIAPTPLTSIAASS